jgi:hypothetical protein
LSVGEREGAGIDFVGASELCEGLRCEDDEVDIGSKFKEGDGCEKEGVF